MFRRQLRRNNTMMGFSQFLSRNTMASFNSLPVTTTKPLQPQQKSIVDDEIQSSSSPSAFDYPSCSSGHQWRQMSSTSTLRRTKTDGKESEGEVRATAPTTTTTTTVNSDSSATKRSPKRTIHTHYFPYPFVKTNPLVFLDLVAGEMALDRITIELFSDMVPKTAENFRSLCTGERGDVQWVDTQSGKAKLHYQGIPFHRIIPGFILQGGDIVYKDGRGNDSIFGYKFLDEGNFEGKSGKNLSGTVAMANSGPNQNGSQFFFNLADNTHLDGKYIVVGQVIEGWGAVQIAAKQGSRSGCPISQVWVSECGQSGGVGAEEIMEEHPHQTLEVFDMLRPRGI